MKTLNTVMALATSCGAVLAVACSGGPADVGTQNLSGGRDAPLDPREAPGSTALERPGGSTSSGGGGGTPTPRPPRDGGRDDDDDDNGGRPPRDSGGGTPTVPEAGAGGDTPANCPPCGRTYRCTVGNDSITIPLQGAATQCATDTGIVLECGGRLVQNGEQSGTWRASNGGATLEFCGQDGQCLTCQAQ